MIRRYALTDAQWQRIEDLVPGRAGHVGRPAANNRLFVNAVLYRYRAGIAWRDLPERFGDFRVIHLRHSRWSRSGVHALAPLRLRSGGCSMTTLHAPSRAVEPRALLLAPAPCAVNLQ